MNTKHTESKLLTRQASKEENDLLISRIDSTYEAAKLRNTLYDKSPENFHTPVAFSWSAFII